MTCLCNNWSVFRLGSRIELGAKTCQNVKMCVSMFFVVVLVQEYQNSTEVCKWAQINMVTLICVFESVRLMHFIQFCNMITESLLFIQKI